MISMKGNPQAHHLAADLTDYARSIGYLGQRPVVVLDGKVISHRRQDWFLFCDSIRRLARRQQRRRTS